MWLKSPDFLLKPKQKDDDTEPSFNLVNPASDPDICPQVTSCATQGSESFRIISGGCANSKLIPVSTDPSFPFILTPATLLTQKVRVPSIPPGDFKDSDLCKRRCNISQTLSGIVGRTNTSLPYKAAGNGNQRDLTCKKGTLCC
ncbi:Callose synthase 5 [Dissostichus eleginoides]|uniref:Callose synthase 5 n=1 Tax=Dissostichus eleginoides TaxID=100907 RepID=A0AAD9EQN9_DISEL|nr:Callose synthase 5 [Dissostichus eleginoides]